MNRNFIAALAASFLASLTFAQDLSKKVTVDIPASRASVLFEKLSAATGVPLRAAANMGDEVMLVSVKDVTVDELMKKIALAEEGTWTRQGEGFILGRDPGIATQQERRELAARAAGVKAAIDKAVQEQAKVAPWSGSSAQQLAAETRKALEEFQQRMRESSGPRPVAMDNLRAIGAKTPANAAAVEVLKTLDPAYLAQIPVGGRAVFSTNSTPMQLRITGAGIRAFQNFVKQQQEYAEAYSQGEEQSGNNRMMMNVNGLSTPTLGPGKAAKGLGVGLLIVTRQSNGALDTQLIAADPDLETISSGSYSLQLNPNTLPPNTSKDGALLEFSPLTLELAKAQSGGARQGGQPQRVMAVSTVATGSTKAAPGSFTIFSSGNSEKIKISDELRKHILQPDLYDPLSYGVSEAFVGLGKAENENVVAVLPDIAYAPINTAIATGKLNSQTLRTLAESTCGMSLQTDGGWLIATPKEPAGARGSRVDRKALKAVLNQLQNNATLPLDDVAAYAYQAKVSPTQTSLDTSFVRLIDASAADRDFGGMMFGNFPVYKLYGSFSPAQKQAVLNEKRIMLSDLTQAQLGLVSTFVFTSFGGPNVQRPVAQNAGNSVISSTFVMAGGGRAMAFNSGTVKDERTVVLPNGITRDGYIDFSVTNSDAVLAINSQTGATNVFDAGSLGFSRYAATNPEMSGIGTATYDKYRMARQTRISLSFQFSEMVSISSMLSDASIAGGEPVSYDSLPEDFRKQVEETAAKLKEGMGKMPQFKQSAPPPQK